MGRESDILGLYPETLAVPPGGSYLIAPLPGQLSVVLKYVSGGSLSVVGASMIGGSSLAINNVYTLGTEFLSMDCTGPFWLSATGATAVADMVRGIAQPGIGVTSNGSKLPY